MAWQLAEADRLTSRLSRRDLLDEVQVRRLRRVTRAALRQRVTATPLPTSLTPPERAA